MKKSMPYLYLTELTKVHGEFLPVLKRFETQTRRVTVKIVTDINLRSSYKSLISVLFRIW